MINFDDDDDDDDDGVVPATVNRNQIMMKPKNNVLMF